MPVYLGPADVLEYDGKYYRVGDNVPMSDELVSHHAMMGHRFKGNDPALLEGVVAGYTPVPPLAGPFDDRGQQLTLKETSGKGDGEVVDEKATQAATATVTAPAPTPAPKS